MSFTNIGLVEHAKKALNENWGYVNGTYGNILTTILMHQKCNQSGGVGEYNTYWKDRYIKNFIGKRVSDCYGLVKSYVWWTGETISPVYNRNGFTDRNQEGAYNISQEKGLLTTMPEIPGIILWMKGHVGIYIGNGEFIECAGCPIGTRKGTVKNGIIKSGSKFTHWFKDNWITYLEKEKGVDEIMAEIKRYKNISEMPIFYQDYIKKWVDAGYIKGNTDGTLDMSEDMVRCLIIAERMQTN